MPGSNALHTPVAPYPGVALADAAEALRHVHTNLSNLRSQIHVADQIVDAYLAWANDSARHLRTRLSAADIDRLVQTRRFWAIQAAPHEGMARVVDTEIDSALEALHLTIAASHHIIERWGRAEGRLVVADPSFFINHPDKIADVDFAAILSCREAPVRLMLPILVLDELDGLKQASKARARWRAGHTLGVFDRAMAHGAAGGRIQDEDYTPLQHGGVPRGRVVIEVYFDPAGHTRLPINDDELIDRALAIQAESGRTVTFLTYDTAQSTRARFAGLEVIKLNVEAGPEPAS